MIARNAYSSLLKWRENKKRKPLLIRGARQVGKTTMIRQFSVEFDHYVELNLERSADRELFDIDNINNILNAAYLLKGVNTDKGSTLLFIDEIQESPKVMQLLRYFYEERPELYVIAAGSLLEFALSEIPSFPVGRIEYLYLHPLNFIEYLGAIGHNEAISIMNTVPIPAYAHSIILTLFHEYAIIGGMPDVVAEYIENKNIAALSNSYDTLWQAYKDDVEKYARNTTDKKIIRHVIETAPFETDRIKFEQFGRSSYASREVGEALRSLDLAKIVQLIYPTTAIAPPIIPDIRKRPRLQFLDTGMINNVLLLQGEMIGINDLSAIYKGKIIQHLVNQELISVHGRTNYKPHFWVREKKDSNSEVDLVYRHGKYVIPIEIKSGKQGTLRSLHQFVERSPHPYAVRMYGGAFDVGHVATPNGTPYILMSLPYYLGTLLPTYLEYFIGNYEL